MWHYAPVSEPASELSSTFWERRVTRALETANTARKGVVILRVVAAVVAVASIVGNYLYWYTRPEVDGDLGFDTSEPWIFGQLLVSTGSGLAFAGIVFGLSSLLSVYAARLDLDIVLANEQETGGGGGS